MMEEETFLLSSGDFGPTLCKTKNKLDDIAFNDTFFCTILPVPETFLPNGNLLLQNNLMRWLLF